MKNIITFMLILISSITLKAQKTIPDTAYIQDLNLHRFDGEWKYSATNISFKIILKTEKTFNDIYNNYTDQIGGYHVFIHDNNIVQSSIGKQKTLRYGTYLNDNDKSVLLFSFKDSGRPISGHAVLTLLPNGQIKWHLRNREGVRVMVKGKELSSEDRQFYVPKDLILTKVN